VRTRRPGMAAAIGWFASVCRPSARALEIVLSDSVDREDVAPASSANQSSPDSGTTSITGREARRPQRLVHRR
jgi:hypothetical protein